LLLLASAVQAQPETAQQRRAAAETLVRSLDSLMGPERIMASMRGAFQAPLEMQLKSASHLTLQQRDRAAAVLGDALALTMGEWMKEVMPGMYATMTDVYVERFTLAEIADIQRFYDSSAGRKSATVMQEDMPRLMAPMMQTLQSRAPQIKARMDAATEQLKAEGIVLQPDRR
jgi:hypothetical protein